MNWLTRSCVWTSWPDRGVMPSMDDDTKALIALLCTRIGMIMEDTTVTALTIGHCDPDLLPAALDRIEGSAMQISALIAATKVLLF